MADTPLTLLTTDSAPSLDDIVYVVDDPTGLKQPRRVSLSDIYALFKAQAYDKAQMTYEGAVITLTDSNVVNVPLDTSLWSSPAGLANTANGRFDIQTTGYYLLLAEWQTTVTGFSYSEGVTTYIYNNGSVLRRQSDVYPGPTSEGAYFVGRCVTFENLTAADKITMYVSQNSDSTNYTKDGDDREYPRMTVIQLA